MIRLGEIVPLHLQLYDGNEDMTVMVEVLSPMQDTLFEGELLHVKNGLYESQQFRMPMVDNVICTYIVYDGKTESKNYERATDIFLRDISPQLVQDAVAVILTDLAEATKTPEEEVFLVGNQISEVNSGGFMEGIEHV
jgi:hypothetical protein